MAVIKKRAQEGEKDWENPIDPEQPVDSRDDEQIQRQKKEAKIRKGNLTDKDYLDKK